MTPVRAAVETPTGPPPASTLLDDDGDGRGLRDYWRILRNYFWSIAALALLGGAIGFMSALSTPSMYRADTRLLVQVTGSSVSGLSPFEPLPIQWLFFETQKDLLTSRAVAEDVARRLNLDQPEPESGPGQGGDGARTPGVLGEHLASIKALLRSWQRFIPDEFKQPTKPPPDAAERMARAVERVRSGIIVEGGRDSEVVIVGFQSTDPREAALIANTIARAYIDFGLRSRRSNAEQTGGWLRERLEELRAKLAESENALRAFQAREGLVDTANQNAATRARIDSLTQAQINAATARSRAQARYRELKSAQDSLGDGDAALLSLLDDPLVAELASKKLRLDGRVSELAERYGEKHPKMISARAELTDVTRTLSAQVNKALAAIRNEAEVARAQEERLGVLVKESEKAVRDASGKAFRLTQLERDVESNRKLYEAFLDRFKQADIADDNELSNIRVIDPARPPTAPFKPNRQRIVMLSVLGGMLIGIILALLRDHLDGTLKDREEVERVLALPVLGVVPLLRGRAARDAQRYLSLEPRSQFGEAINDVRTGIMLSDVDHPPGIILITSATADEGKTTLAANLAACLARRGATLLVDADLRRGESARILGIDPCPGLADYCAGDSELEQVIHAAPEQAGLFLLPKGGVVPNPLEVLSSQRFKDALATLRADFEHIVIDSPPLLPVSDSIVLAREADSVVFVVRAGRTTADMATDALKRIQSARVQPVGAVLQHCDIKRSRSYAYGYGSYYQYGNNG